MSKFYLVYRFSKNILLVVFDCIDNNKHCLFLFLFCEKQSIHNRALFVQVNPRGHAKHIYLVKMDVLYFSFKSGK